MAEGKHRVAVLTGASRGIGRVLARALAQHGMDLALVGRGAPPLEALRRELGGSGARIEAYPADLTDVTERRNVAIRIQTTFGRVDVLVNNAGVEGYAHFHRQRPADIQTLFDTNALVPILLTHEFLPDMLARGRGHVVNISSLAGMLGLPYASVYAGTKAALSQWSLSLNAELQGSGVTLSVVCPGFVDEAGSFARRGRKAPPGLGTSSPDEVAKAMIRAIDTGAPEIFVNRQPIRPLLALRSQSARAMIRLARRMGWLEFLKKLAETPPESDA